MPSASSLSGYLSSGPFSSNDFHLNADLAAGLVGFNSPGMLQTWTNQNQINMGMPTLSVSRSSPPPSNSPSSLNVKNEPISPPRDLNQHHPQGVAVRGQSNQQNHLSPAHPPLTPSTSSSPDPSGGSDFEDGPSVHKRMRVSDSNWPAWTKQILTTNNEERSEERIYLKTRVTWN